MSKQYYYANPGRVYPRVCSRRHRGLNTIAAFLLILCTFRIISLSFSYRHALSAKYTETDFTSLGFSDESLLQPNQRSSFLSRRLFRAASDGDHLLDNRYAHVRDLGFGWEGWTKVYLDKETRSEVVVKSFNTKHSPLRNHIPEALAETFHGQHSWPTEILAGLLLGGFATGNLSSNAGLQTTVAHDFVPVLDYFLASEDPLHPAEAPMQWYLVMPLVDGGNLRSLAKRIRKSSSATFHDIDLRFRPVLHRLLSTLETLHVSGICHDDISSGNIFVLSPDIWLLGDLGAVREFAHPFHGSRIWADARQFARCDLNDVHRALKVYLAFLRSACSHPREFDTEFYAATHSWSRLYWSFVERPMSAAVLKQYSTDREPAKAAPHIVTSLGGHEPSFFPAALFVGRERALSRAVESELATSLSDSFARKLGLVWLFDVRT